MARTIRMAGGGRGAARAGNGRQLNNRVCEGPSWRTLPRRSKRLHLMAKLPRSTDCRDRWQDLPRHSMAVSCASVINCYGMSGDGVRSDVPRGIVASARVQRAGGGGLIRLRRLNQGQFTARDRLPTSFITVADPGWVVGVCSHRYPRAVPRSAGHFDASMAASVADAFEGASARFWLPVCRRRHGSAAGDRRGW